MPGLLKKARTLRTSYGLPVDGRDEFVFDPDSGISREDQKDILREIEQVATKNRISVSPEVFAVKAAKRGVLFPVLVNVAAILALAGGLALLYVFFQRGESQLARSDTGTITAEGKLIEEVKRESEAKLQEKNQQISQIQGRLADIDRQRQDLLTTMDSKVSERERQLRASLAAELEAEKARLQNQGLSEQDINRRLADLQSQKNAESARQLDEYRAQAEAERQKADGNLRNLQAEFSANLAQASQERQQVLDESKKREADLKAQLEQKAHEAESAQARSDQALRALQSQKQEEDLASGQLVGLYSVVKGDIGAKDYQGAIKGLQAIRDYVTSTDVGSLPLIAQRRDVDLFVVDSLANLVQGQLSQASVDTGTLVAAAGQISDVRAAVAQADSEVKAGNIAEAEKAYATALSVIPEIARSYAFFSAKERDTENARQTALRAGLARAETAFDARRYPEMLAAYKDALAYLPETSARLDRTLSNIAAGGSEQGKARAVGEQTRAAAPLLRQADVAAAQGRPADALSSYLTILDRYPQSRQAVSAVRGVATASAALNEQAASRLAARERDLGLQIEALRKQVADRGTEVTGIKKSVMALVGQQGDPRTTDTAALMAALAAKFGGFPGARDASSELTRRLQAAEDNSAALQVKIDSLMAENDTLKEAAKKQAAVSPAPQAAAAAGVSADDARLLRQLDRLADAYSRYASQEDAIIGSQGEQKGRLRTIGLRDTFLGSLDGMFKGLLDRVHRYDARFISDSMAQGKQEGRQSALQEALDIVIDLGKLATPEERKSFLDQRLKTADKDTLLKGFLRTLQRLPEMR